jgi:DNA (cytosine-5)-methyltransferase 1
MTHLAPQYAGKRVRATFSVAEFFAGIGLVRLGLERSGGQVIFANDLDPRKLEMYRALHGGADDHFLLADVHRVGAESVPKVDVATASFPCTDLSLAGARKGLAGPQSSAFWGFIGAIRSMVSRPKLIMLENVPGFLTSNNGRDFRAAMLALNDLGYAVDPFLVDAAAFVPQSRQRLFVIASATSERPREGPLFLFAPSTLRPKAVGQAIGQNPDIQWAIRPLPEPPERRQQLEDILEDLPHDSPEWWSVPRTCYLLNQMSERHRQLIDAGMLVHRWQYGTVFRRVRAGRSMAELRTDGVAGCLRTPKGGSARQILVKYGWGTFLARLLTPRECGRLMGLNSFDLDVPPNQALFGLGDAVCVDVVAWIAEHYIVPKLREIDVRRVT